MISRLKEELQTLYRTREKDLIYDRQSLRRRRIMTATLLLYADPCSPVYKLPNPAGYARKILEELEILLPPKSQESLEVESHGHKGVAGILSDLELSTDEEET